MLGRDVRGTLLRVLKRVRAELEVADPHFPIDRCEDAATALSHALRLAGYSCRHTYGTYILRQDGTFGSRDGHDWVVLVVDGEEWVADITADQYGGEPIVLLPQARASRYREGEQPF